MTSHLRPFLTLVLLLTLAVGPRPTAAAPSPRTPEDDAILDTALHAAQALSDPYARARSIISVARAYAEASLTKKAEELVEEARRSAVESPLARHLLLEAAEACARTGLRAKAFELADAMQYLPHAVHVLCLTAAHQLDAGDREGAVETLKRACGKADRIQEPEDAGRARVRIAETYARLGLAEEFGATLQAAAESASEMHEELNRAVLLETIAQAYQGAGRLDDALRVAGMVGAPGSRVSLLTALGLAYAEAGKATQAAAAMADSVRIAAAVPEASQRAFLLLQAAEAAYAAGIADVADRALGDAGTAVERCPDSPQKEPARDRLASVLIAAARFADAEQLIRRTNDPTRRTDQLLRLALAYAAAGRYEEAVRAAEKADPQAVRLVGTPRLQAVGLAYARAWGKQADVKRIARIEPPELRDAVLAQYAQDTADTGNFEAALQYARAVDSYVTHDAALGAVATTCLAVADSPESLAPVSKALELTAGALDRLQLRSKLARRMAELGLQTPAREALQSLAQDAEEEKLPAARAELLGEVALSFGLLDEWEAARQAAVKAIVAALQVACAGCRDDVVRDLFKQLSGPQYVDLAFAAAEQIEAPGVRAENFLRMFEISKGLTAEQSERLLRGALEAAAQATSLPQRVTQLTLVASYYRRTGVAVTEAERKMLLRSRESAVAPPVQPAPAPAPGPPDQVRLVYFDRPGCPQCEEAKASFEKLRQMFTPLTIETFDLATSESAALLNVAICEGLAIGQEQRLVAPSVFSARGGLIGSEVTLVALAELARGASGLPSPVELFGPKREDARARLEESYRDLGLLVVVSAALADGINPCAFTVIIFFLSYLAYMGRERRQIAAVGVVFTLAVFVTYFAIGLGLASLVKAAEAWSGVAMKAIHAVTAGLVIVAAALSFRDGVRCLQGRTAELALVLPDRLKSKIRLTISRRARMGLTVAATIALGAVVALFEFPCTGQVYLPVIVFGVRHLPQYVWGPVGWLLLYNLFFIVPLIAVFVAVFFGLTSERLTALFRRHIALTKFALAAVFAGLGAYMIFMLVR